MAGSGVQTIVLFALEIKSPLLNSSSELPPSNTSPLLSTFRFCIHRHSSHPPPSILPSSTVDPSQLSSHHLLVSCAILPLHVFPTIILAMPPHRCAVISGLVGPNGTPPVWPDPIILNGTPDPELVTIGTDFEHPTRGLVRPCCLHCAKAMVNNPALVCHHPTWWVNCLCCYWQHDKCHNVSAPVSVLAPLICCVGPKRLFPNPAPSAGGGGRLARGREALGPDRLTRV